MTFSKNVRAMPSLAEHFKPGLQALKRQDRGHISAPDAAALKGSIDIDTALKSAMPNDARWDYVVACNSGATENAYWIEVHPAGSTGNAGELDAKLTWLLQWLETDGRLLDIGPRRFVWVASGRSVLSQTSPQIRKLAAKGLHFAGGHFSLPGKARK